MTAFKVALQLENIARSKSGSITAPIWLQYEARHFPCAGWSDFPVVILGWWLASAASIRQGRSEAVCMFMDGPFEFHISKRPAGHVHMRFVDAHGQAAQDLNELVLPFDTLQAALWIAAKEVVAECMRRSWKGSDISSLQAALSSPFH